MSGCNTCSIINFPASRILTRVTSFSMNVLREEVDRILVTIALNKSIDVIEERNLSSVDRARLSDALLAFIQTDNYWAAAKVFSELIQTQKPLDYVRSVLSIPDTPIPTLHPSPTLLASKAQLRRPWTEYEDMRLIAGIHKYGLVDFHLVAKFVGNGRSQWQCRQRWTRGIDPSISKEKWTEAEDNELIEAVKAFGLKQWKKVATRLPSRSDVQCRYRYLLLTKKNTIDTDVASPDEISEPFEDQPVRKEGRVLLPSITTFDPALEMSPFLRMVLARA